MVCPQKRDCGSKRVNRTPNRTEPIGKKPHRKEPWKFGALKIKIEIEIEIASFRHKIAENIKISLLRAIFFKN